MSRLLAAALALAALIPAAAFAQPPVWIVTDADSEMVLFGSVHVLPPGLDWRPAALDAALAEADDVWFELPVDAAADLEAAQAAMTRGVLPAGASLSSLLSAEGAARIQRLCERYGLAPALIDRLEPWFAEVALAAGAYRQAGADVASGVEKTLATAAPVGAAQRAFETPAEQIAMFDAAPLDEQTASLEASLKEMEDDPGAFDHLVAAWMDADLAALEADALGPLRQAAPALYDRVVTARNAAWTHTLDTRLKGSGRTVVVVGVGHLLGEGGVPERLRALGYSVQGP